MVTPRRRIAADAATGTSPKLRETGAVEHQGSFSPASLRAALAIDMDDLDECLIRQPELYYHASELGALAKAARDEAKLDLELLEAAEGQHIRDLALKNEEKLTEGSLREQLLLSPKVERAKRELLELTTTVTKYDALKDSFQQRSYMLRELVPLHLSRMGGSSSSGVHPRARMADHAREVTGQERTRRREADKE